MDRRTLAGPESITEEANRLVFGDRAAAYGSALADYRRVARLWSVVLGVEVTARQAALCMVLLKVSRLIHKQSRDSLVDVAGYAEVLNLIVLEEEQEQP